MRAVPDAGAPLRIITLMSADGVEERTLWEGPNEFRNVPQMWVTRDGEYVLLAGVLKDETFVLLSFNLETGERREVHRGGAMREISLHPDGSRIAFSRGVGKGEIWVMEGFR